MSILIIFIAIIYYFILFFIFYFFLMFDKGTYVFGDDFRQAIYTLGRYMNRYKISSSSCNFSSYFSEWIHFS